MLFYSSFIKINSFPLTPVSQLTWYSRSNYIQLISRRNLPLQSYAYYSLLSLRTGMQLSRNELLSDVKEHAILLYYTKRVYFIVICYYLLSAFTNTNQLQNYETIEVRSNLIISDNPLPY